jgi:hypothetical protein
MNTVVLVLVYQASLAHAAVTEVPVFDRFPVFPPVTDGLADQ